MGHRDGGMQASGAAGWHLKGRWDLEGNPKGLAILGERDGPFVPVEQTADGVVQSYTITFEQGHQRRVVSRSENRWPGYSTPAS